MQGELLFIDGLVVYNHQIVITVSQLQDILHKLHEMHHGLNKYNDPQFQCYEFADFAREYGILHQTLSLGHGEAKAGVKVTKKLLRQANPVLYSTATEVKLSFGTVETVESRLHEFGVECDGTLGDVSSELVI
nr:hypothetical protein BaRGS_002805 [Batillaria attramentaria]